VRRLQRRQQLLEEAEREPAALDGDADLLERVPALADAGDEPGVADRGGRPRAGVLRDEAAVDPAAQRGGGAAEPARDLGRAGRPVVHYAPAANTTTAGPGSRRLRAIRPAASVDGARLRTGGTSRMASHPLFDLVT
jgi:hypothetical protein